MTIDHDQLRARSPSDWAEATRFTIVFFIVNLAAALLDVVFGKESSTAVETILQILVYASIPMYVGTVAARFGMWLIAWWGRPAAAPRIPRTVQFWLALAIVPPLGAAAIGSVTSGLILLAMQFVVGAILTWLRRSRPARTNVPIARTAR